VWSALSTVRRGRGRGHSYILLYLEQLISSGEIQFKSFTPPLPLPVLIHSKYISNSFSKYLELQENFSLTRWKFNVCFEGSPVHCFRSGFLYTVNERRWNSWNYHFVEVSRHNLEISQTWGIYLRFCLSTKCNSWTNLSVLPWLRDFWNHRVWFGFLSSFAPFHAVEIKVSMGISIHIAIEKVL
jgi:hypothetical protein